MLCQQTESRMSFSEPIAKGALKVFIVWVRPLIMLKTRLSFGILRFILCGFCWLEVTHDRLGVKTPAINWRCRFSAEIFLSADNWFVRDRENEAPQAAFGKRTSLSRIKDFFCLLPTTSLLRYPQYRVVRRNSKQTGLWLPEKTACGAFLSPWEYF